MKNRITGVPIGTAKKPKSQKAHDMKPLVRNILPAFSPMRKYILLAMDIRNNGADMAACSLRWPLGDKNDFYRVKIGAYILFMLYYNSCTSKR